MELAEKEGREAVLLPPFSCHNLRHTFCTRYCENETNLKVIQEIMGHKDIATTMEVYAEAAKDTKVKSFENLEGKIKISQIHKGGGCNVGKVESNTPYDDVCRTLTVECDDLVIPLINEIFGENYSLQDKVIRRANEHFLEQQGGAEEKRVTDMLLEIVSKATEQEKKYHIECESSSSDGTILIRIFEYAAQIALDDGKVTGEKLIVDFPNSAIIFLRSKKTVPKQMEISVRTPGGETSYYIPALHIRDYTMEDIFKKRLYFLIPFYIFNIESKFSEIEASRDKVEELKKFYVDMMLKLEGAVSMGELTEFSYLEIRDMTNRVVQNLAKNYKSIRKGVGDIMGGKVLVTEVSKARNKGREEEAIAVVENMLRKGKQPEEIAELCNYALEDVKIVQERMLQ